MRARPLGTPGRLRWGESWESVWQDVCDGLDRLAAAGLGNDTNEEGLSRRLFEELQIDCDRRPYFFHPDRKEDGTRGRPDLVVQAKVDGFVLDGISYARRQPFLALEAKRLPSPRADRRREYLVHSAKADAPADPEERAELQGEKGGVARFKLGIHAPALKIVGIIGYVQRHSFDHWRETINRWIDELIASPPNDLRWDECDKLQLESSTPTLARLQSQTWRVTDNQQLVVHHLWVQLAAQLSG